MCWDKTGTLTVPELFLTGIDTTCANRSEITPTNYLRSQKSFLMGSSKADDASDSFVLSNPNSLERMMVCCHQASIINGVLVGHSVDLETIRHTSWRLTNTSGYSLDSVCIPTIGTMIPSSLKLEPGVNSDSLILILVRFEFDAYLQASSVIAATPQEIQAGTLNIYVKGSPESMLHLCKPDSIPENFTHSLQNYAMQGYYVIGCAYRAIEAFDITTESLSKFKRKNVECNLIFIGFLLFENPLKDEAISTIDVLINSHIRNVMITGDNPLTAIHVSRKLNLCKHVVLIDKIGTELVFSEIPNDIDLFEARANLTKPIHTLVETLSLMPDQTEICVTGAALEVMSAEKDYNYVNWIIGRSRIFARINPDQKTWIVNRFISLGKFVGFCGDGTNDCGALKAAHVGLALSDSQASIIAPFTSSRKLVGDILHLIREGRCAVETSVVSFKFMVLYPIVQLLMSSTLNSYGSAMSNNQFFFDDMAIVTTLALCMLYTKASPTLTHERPRDDLFNVVVVSSLVGQLVLCITFFYINLVITTNQVWYCSVTRATSNLDSYFNAINNTLPICYP